MAIQIISQISQFTTLFDYVGGTNPIYIGMAQPTVGNQTTLAVWQIRKLTYDGNGNPTNIQYANSSTDFNQIWANRTSLTYQ